MTTSPHVKCASDRTLKVKKAEKMLFREAIINPSDIFLHSNCGARLIDGFVNIDTFYEDEGVVNYALDSLPFVDGSVNSIYSSYLLENLAIADATSLLQEWKRVLVRGSGRLLLSVPDNLEVYRQLLDPSTSDDRSTWLNHLMRGEILHPMLKGQSICNLHDMLFRGFTEATLLRELWDKGFRVKEMFSYEGESSPSVWVEAYA